MHNVYPLLLTLFMRHGIIIELAVSIAMFTWWLPRRQYFVARVACSIVGIIAVSAIWERYIPSFPWSDVVWFMLLLAMFSTVIWQCWNISFQRGLLYLVAGGVMQHLAFRGAGIVESLALSSNVVDQSQASVVYAIALIPFYIVGYVVLAASLKGKTMDGINSQSIILLLIAMLLCVNVFKYLYDLYGDSELSNMFILFSTFDLITCVFLLALLNEIVDRASVLRTNEMLEQLIYQQKVQMESNKETIDLVNVKAHDLKKQLALLKGRIGAQEINELNDLVNDYDATVHTGNEALDIILTQKNLVCMQKDIQLGYIVDGEMFSFMTAADIYALFGNALDNAVEAIDNMSPEPSDRRKRYISVHARAIKGMLSIHIENPYQGKLREGPNGLLTSTKDDRNHHGFGMRSMEMICNKYGGWFSFKTTRAVFELNILIPF